MWMTFCLYMCTTWVSGVWGGPEEDTAMDHLEQEFRLAVSLPEAPAWVVTNLLLQSCECTFF